MSQFSFRHSLRASRLLISALAVALCLAQADAESRPRPNIVVILIDDLGWADLGVQGSRYYTTPNLDKFAAESVRFTQGYAGAALCSPSRAALLTGRTPARLHVTDFIPGHGQRKNGRFALPQWSKRLDPAVPNLARALREQGYVTASIGKWHLGGSKHSPKLIGFDEEIAVGRTGRPGSHFWPYGPEGGPNRVLGLAEAGGKQGEYLADRLTDEAIGFIQKNQKRPFFLYLPHFAVHAPVEGKPEDVELFADKTAVNGQDNPKYAAMVKSVDDSVGRILAELKKLDLEKDTIVVFTSDNGGAIHIGSTRMRPLRAGKGFPYEGGIRVPFIVRAPGVGQPGLVSTAPVSSLDLFPTLTALSGKKVEGLLDGTDITPALRGEKTAPRQLGWHYPHYWNAVTPYSVLRDGDWKIIRWYEYDTDELYDLAGDPYEKKDLAKTHPEKLAELRSKLEAWLKANDAQLPVLKKDAPPAPDFQKNPAAADKWR